MSRLSAKQVLGLALAAGFNRTEANTMVVIAYYESGWDPKNVGDTRISPPKESRGLWQIWEGAWPVSSFGYSSNDELFDPAKNAHAARVVYKAQGFHAWSTYNSYRYSSGWKSLLSKVAALAAPVQSPKTASTVADERAAQESEHPTHDYTDLCLKFVRTMLLIPAKYPTAAAAWRGAGGAAGKYTHTLRPPKAGFPVFFAPNHIALANDATHVWSTDIRRKGKVDLVPIKEIESKWGLRYLGWSEVLNGQKVNPNAQGL